VTPDELIALYIKLRDFKAGLIKEQKAALAPYDEAMTAIENALMEALNAAGVSSMKGEHGTAFKKQSMSVKTVDRDALFEYVLNTGKFNYLTAAVSKEAVVEHLEAHNNVPPPGVDVTLFTEVQVRKPS